MTVPEETQLNGLGMVYDARLHQKDSGHTPLEDAATREPGDLATAGVCLAQAAVLLIEGTEPSVEFGAVHPFWPWSSESWRDYVSRGPEWMLAQAGALCAAEIDRGHAARDIL